MTGNQEFFNLIKKVVDNYMENRSPARVVTGTYNGSAVLLSNYLPVPMSMIHGNMKSRLRAGDKLRMLRNDGGREYYIMEIIGRPYQLGE